LTTLELRALKRFDLEATARRLWLRVASVSFLTYALLGAIALGVGVRAFHVLSSDFPLNDGGLFYAMTRDLQDNSYRLPEFTSYNGGGIPFTYPPVGFYLAALLEDLTPLSLLEVFRWLPLIVTCLTIPAFYLLARSVLKSPLAVVASVFAFALVPRGFMWLLMGGGVTRSLGFLFAILALYCVHQLYTENRRTALPWAIVLSALTVLSHLETGWFLAFSIAVFFLGYGRDRRAFADSLLLCAGVLTLTLPWALSVLAMHGLDPIEAAAGSGGSVFSGGEMTRQAYLGLLNVTSTSEPLFPLIGVLAAVGGLALAVSRRFVLPLWWASIILLDVRAFPTFTSLPIALMAGVAIAEVVIPMIERQRASAAEPDTPRYSLKRYAPLGAVLAGFVLFGVGGALLRAGGLNGEAMHLRGLSESERTAIEWARRETPASSVFLIVPDSTWETAKTAEWFPALSGRLNLTTVQGTEWLNDNGFDQARAIYDRVYDCGIQTSVCLEELSDETGIQFDYIYVRKGDVGQCCYTLLRSLDEDDGYRLVYDADGATIYYRRPSGEPAVRAPFFGP
jgi:hypothetical protein